MTQDTLGFFLFVFMPQVSITSHILLASSHYQVDLTIEALTLPQLLTTTLHE
jgi:hypothetical protein